MTAQQLAEDNIKLAYYFAHRYKGKGVDDDDLFSMACVGLVKAANAFDETRGLAFSTLAVICIKREMMLFFRNGKNKIRPVSFEEPVKEGITLADTIEDGDRFDETFTEIDSLQHAISCLTEIQAQVIRLWYLSIPEKSQCEVAEIIGSSQANVSRVEKRALSKLREMIMA